MWCELESSGEINSRMDRLLRVADAYGRFPTPVDDIVEAAELTYADDYVLDESLIRKAPQYLHRLLRSARQKIQGLVDRRARVVHVSPAIENEGKKRFVKLHETVHHITPTSRTFCTRTTTRPCRGRRDDSSSARRTTEPRNCCSSATPSPETPRTLRSPRRPSGTWLIATGRHFTPLARARIRPLCVRNQRGAATSPDQR